MGLKTGAFRINRNSGHFQGGFLLLFLWLQNQEWGLSLLWHKYVVIGIQKSKVWGCSV